VVEINGSGIYAWVNATVSTTEEIYLYIAAYLSEYFVLVIGNYVTVNVVLSSG
jgi:hypothetical protein